jgi:ketosteroid isomerase-like protein
MARENVEIVTAALEAAFARPDPDFATLNRLYAADHVLVPAGAAGGIEDEARGMDGYKAWREETGSVMEPELEVKGVVDAGPDKVLAVISNHFSGRSSGVTMEQRMWLVVTIKGGKISRTQAYTDSAKALEAAGLSE